jgi:hydrogenase maturation protease
MSAPATDVAVIGLGNVVLSDDGLGVHAVRRLRDRGAWPPDVAMIEGGTAGLLLLPHLADSRRVILVDAIERGAAPGTLVSLDADGLGDAFAAGMTAHDVGLRDLLGAARLSGAWPEEVVLHGIQPGSMTIGTALTPPVAAAVDALVDRIAAELAAWAGVEAP